MSRISFVNNPFLLGFEDIERVLDKVSKTTDDNYPPYNIERLSFQDGKENLIRITLAVAGFSKDDLEITVEDKQLLIIGRQKNDETKEYLHRGIAARQFKRTFVLADGIEVIKADLENGLLSIDLVRPEPETLVRKVKIIQHD